MFILSASLPLWRVDGEFPGFPGHTVLTCGVGENKLLLGVLAYSTGTALGWALQSFTRIPSFTFEEI